LKKEISLFRQNVVIAPLMAHHSIPLCVSPVSKQQQNVGLLLCRLPVEVWKLDAAPDCQLRDQTVLKDGRKGGGMARKEIHIKPLRSRVKGGISMKKFLIIAFAILILAAAFMAAKVTSAAQDDSAMLSSPQGAVLELQPLVNRKKNDEINFRVRVKNIGTMSANNLNHNLVVYLRVKNEKTGQWDELQKWSNIHSIKAGDTVARDRTPVKTENIDVQSSAFTLQAEIVLNTPGDITISRHIVESSYPVDSIKNP
jgi:hypothetical protein